MSVIIIENQYVSFDDAYYKILRVQIFLMRLFGFYHKRNGDRIQKYYCILVNIIVWYSFLKGIFVFNLTDGETFTDVIFIAKLNSFIWLFSCATIVTLLFLMQESKLKIDAFESCYNEIFQYEKNPKVLSKRLAIISAIISICSFGLCVCNSVVCLVGLFRTDSLYYGFEQYMAPFQNNESIKTSIAFKIFTWVVFTYSSIAWLMPLAYYLVHCIMLYKPLDTFNKAFRQFSMHNDMRQLKFLDQGTITNEIYFDELQKWHLKFLSAIRVLNECFKEFIFISFLVYIPLSFLFLYVLSDWKGYCINKILAFMIPFWLIMALFVIFSIIQSASIISDKVSIFLTRNGYF
jgi:hypothetical protein